MGIKKIIIVIFSVIIFVCVTNSLLLSQIKNKEVIFNNFKEIDMKKKSKNNKVAKNSKQVTKAKEKSNLLVSNDIVVNESVTNETLAINSIENVNISSNLDNQLDNQLENQLVNNSNVAQETNHTPEKTNEQITEQTGTQTKYFSLIFKNAKKQSLDSNQIQFIEKIGLFLKKYPNKRIALLSYVSGNKSPEENLRIAKLRNKYIIDYLTKNGISEDRISKKGVSGLIVKENIELFKSSNIIEIIITEQNKIQKTETK